MELLLIVLLINHMVGWVFTLAVALTFIEDGARCRAEALAEIITLLAGLLLGVVGLIVAGVYNRYEEVE